MSVPFNILILCTGNSARSIIAEAMINHFGGGHVRAYSAGSQPGGRVNPFALDVLAEENIIPIAPRSKSWDDFATPQAPKMNVVITVCDNAAGEACPIWPGAPVSVHWGFPDPASATGTDEDRRAVFRAVRDAIRGPVMTMLALPLADMPPGELKASLQAMAPTPS